jgi:hypothetical protein
MTNGTKHIGMGKMLPWMTRQIDRRRFLSRTTAVAFGLFAGAAVGAPSAEANIPCGPHPDCRSYSSLFCSGHNCRSGANWSCTPQNRNCHSAGGDCWYMNGRKCCDCYCIWCCPGRNAECICYG